MKHFLQLKKKSKLTNQIRRQHKIPKIKKILDNDSDSTIYHYTKPETLLNILACGNIRFSNVLYLNDKDEVAYSYKLIVNLIEETPSLNSELFEKIRNHFKNKYKHITY